MTAGERYLELVLRLGRLAPELIDSYAGPRALAERVGGEAPRDPSALADDACALAEDPGANAWIAAQLTGLGAACEALAGRRAGYRALVERCYGVPVREGLALCEAFATRVPDGYARLLREPFTTADLRSRVET